MFLFKGATPLMAAAGGGNLDIVKLFLKKGANVNDKSITGKFLILYFIVIICLLLLIKIYSQNKKKIYVFYHIK